MNSEETREKWAAESLAPKILTSKRRGTELLSDNEGGGSIEARGVGGSRGTRTVRSEARTLNGNGRKIQAVSAWREGRCELRHD